jgi:hypothetical protein
MAAASRSLATTLQGARFASGLLQPSYTTYRDTTNMAAVKSRFWTHSSVVRDAFLRSLAALSVARGKPK